MYTDLSSRDRAVSLLLFGKTGYDLNLRESASIFVEFEHQDGARNLIYNVGVVSVGAKGDVSGTAS